MVICMKTTLNINDRVIKQLKEEALRRGTTMSELVELSLRSLFQKKDQLRELPPLPAFDGGESRVNITNRDALYEILDQS